MKKPSNYEKCVMYKIICKDENIKDTYIGHTTNFSVRKALHKFYSKKINDRKLYKFVYENKGWDNFIMIEIEKYSCDNKLEALKRERELIENNECSLNYNIPLQTYKELRSKHVDKYNEYMKTYKKGYYNKKKQSKLLQENNKKVIIEHKIEGFTIQF